MHAWQYNFNELVSSTTDEIPNLGHAGSGYDLMLGKLPKPAGYEALGERYQYGGKAFNFVRPLRVPAANPISWAAPKALDATAPLVTSAAPGETISIAEYGVSHTYTAPASFAATAVVAATDSSGNAVTIHVMPRAAPAVATTTSDLSFTLLEDGSIWIKLLGTSDIGSSEVEPMTARISALPTRGRLYDVSNNADTSRSLQITSTGQQVTSTARYVLFVPEQDEYGKPYATFQYTLSVGSSTLSSAAATVVIDVEGNDDLPTTSSLSLALVEDEVPEGVLISLTASDAEVGIPLPHANALASAASAHSPEHTRGSHRCTSYDALAPSSASHNALPPL